MRSKVSSKDKIIDIATKIIEEDGIENCTSRNISEQASIALGTIYNYFNNRDDLLEQVFIKSWQRTAQILLDILNNNESLEQRTYSILVKLTDEVKRRNGLGEYLIFTRNIPLDEIKKKYDHFEGIISVFVALLRESPGSVNSSDEELEALAMWIIFGHMNFVRREHNMETYYNLVIEKLLK